MKFKIPKSIERLWEADVYSQITKKYHPDTEDIHDIISFAVAQEGTPPFIPSKHIIDAVKLELDKPTSNTYTPFDGAMDVREAISKKVMKNNQFKVDPVNEVALTCGTTQGIFASMMVLVNPKDEILVLDPEFIYEPPIRFMDGKSIRVPYKYDKNDYQFKFDVSALEENISENTKLIVFSNPCNPTGYVYSKSDLEAIAELAIKHDCYVFADELYETLVYDNNRHISIASLPGMKERTVTVMGVSKTESMQLFRIGYVIAEPDICRHIKEVILNNTMRAPYISQRALLAFLNEDNKFKKERILNHQKCRDLTVEMLSKVEGLECNDPMGTSYVFPSHKKIEKSSGAFMNYLMKESHVLIEPGIVFGPNGEGHCRLCFPLGQESLEKGLGRIVKTLK